MSENGDSEKKKTRVESKGGSINDLDRERLSVVQLALLDPLEERLAGELGVHAREIWVCPLRRTCHKGIRALERPAYRNTRVEELDRCCKYSSHQHQGQRKSEKQPKEGGQKHREVRDSQKHTNEERRHAPGSHTAATTHAQ